MGQCVSPFQPHGHPTYFYATQPAGTQELRGKTLPKLYFHSILANVKIKNYPYIRAIPHFKVREGQIFTLGVKTCNEHNSMTWKIFEVFDFQMTQYQLRKQFLEISVENESHQQVANIKINLFLITTGPYYHDFQLKFPNRRTGRISFDLKISQIINVKIKSQKMELFLSKKHPGQEFCYSIKAINGYLGASVQSEPSYPTVVLLQKKQKEYSRKLDDSKSNSLTKEAAPELEGFELVLEDQISKKKSKRQSTIELQQGEQLKWNNKGGKMPVITTKIVASNLHNIYFQILVWKYQSQQQTSSKELFADCYVSFYKLLGTEPKIIRQSIKEYQQRSINMTEKLEHLGKLFGSCNFQFTIINEPYFKQYQLGVHTEIGILKNTPIFGIKQTKTNDKSPQLNELILISYSVQQNVIALNKLESDQGPRRKIKDLKRVIQQELLKIYNLLEKSSNPPSFLYTYSSQKQLLQGQKILIQLGMKITNYSQGQDPATTDLCWLILISLLKRGQLALDQMGFSQKQKKQIGSHSLSGILIFKQQVGIVYKVFLYKLLDLALNSIDHKGSQYQRTFAQIFSAYAYFRIPEFRKEILRLITKQTDPQIVQWRGVEFSLEDNEQQKYHDKGNNVFNQMFDWLRHFYKWLAKNEQIQSQNISLNEILAQKSWKERFIKRGSAFFYFIKYWVTYVDSSLRSSKDIQWNYFPGYNRLLKGFFVQLKLRPILQYPDALIDAGLKLLVNYKLLNPIFKILLNKVYVFDTSSVIRVIEYMNMIFQTVGEKHKQLPFSFNYSFFFKAITIIFDSDFSMSVSSVLTLLYTHFQIFHTQFRKSISMYFLGSAFNKFFLHWSHQVRDVFYHFLAYRAYGDALKNQHKGNDSASIIQNSDILTRYQDQMKIMTIEAKNYRSQKKNSSLHPNFEKHLFKKMKIKNFQHNKCRIQDNQEQLVKSDNPFHEISIISSANEQSQGKIKQKHGTVKKERSNSDTLSENISFVHHFSEHKLNKKDQIRRYTRFNEFSYEHQHEGKQSSIFHQFIPQSQFKIGEIDPNSLKLIDNCLASYKIVQEGFKKNFQKGFYKGPELKQEIALDKREIRPKEIDDW